jgi:hypothetical protein
MMRNPEEQAEAKAEIERMMREIKADHQCR